MESLKNENSKTKIIDWGQKEYDQKLKNIIIYQITIIHIKSQKRTKEKNDTGQIVGNRTEKNTAIVIAQK